MSEFWLLSGSSPFVLESVSTDCLCKCVLWFLVHFFHCLAFLLSLLPRVDQQP